MKKLIELFIGYKIVRFILITIVIIIGLICYFMYN
jgi:hypothetical protein